MARTRVSIRSLLLFTVYIAVCSTTYVYPSVWVGTAVVVATIALLASTTSHAFGSQSRFWLWFSTIGWSWLVFWFGFYAETPVTHWELPNRMYAAVTPHMQTIAWRQNWGGAISSSSIQSIHSNFGMSVHGNGEYARQPIPSWQNGIRLFVCVSALVVGCLGGVCAYLATAFQSKRLHYPIRDITKR